MWKTLNYLNEFSESNTRALREEKVLIENCVQYDLHSKHKQYLTTTLLCLSSAWQRINSKLTPGQGHGGLDRRQNSPTLCWTKHKQEKNCSKWIAELLICDGDTLKGQAAAFDADVLMDEISLDWHDESTQHRNPKLIQTLLVLLVFWWKWQTAASSL